MTKWILVFFIIVASNYALVPQANAQTSNRYETTLREAQSGDADAQYNVARMNEYSFTIPPNKVEALKWYLKAAKQGHVKAQFSLGKKYSKGEGVVQSDTEALKWYLKAAKQGYVKAQFTLGKKYSKGDGVVQNDTEASKWFRRAGEQGHLKSLKNIGIFFYPFRGESAYRLSNLDMKGKRGAWHRAALQGDAKMQFNVGQMYKTGIGRPADTVEAYVWFSTSARQGNERAQESKSNLVKQMTPQQIGQAHHDIGRMFSRGNAVSTDYNEAVKWFKLAAEQENTDALYSLGVSYYYGEGVTEDYIKALAWFTLSAKQGHESGLKSAYDVAAKMSREQILESQKFAETCLANNYKNCD